MITGERDNYFPRHVFDDVGDTVPNAEVMRIFMPYAIALRYVDAGDSDRAVDWLEEAYEVRDPMLPYLREPFYYDALRSNPSYQDLLRRMNLPTSTPPPNQS